jgi:hypothetical protein
MSPCLLSANTHTLLFGVGSSNWLPLLAPLIIIVSLGYGADQLVKYIRHKRQQRDIPQADPLVRLPDVDQFSMN